MNTRNGSKRTRAWRRHQRQRAWNKMHRIVKYAWRYYRYETEKEPELITRLTNHMYKNRQGCSCYCCGHQREGMGPTMQEIRQTAWMEPLYYIEPFPGDDIPYELQWDELTEEEWEAQYQWLSQLIASSELRDTSQQMKPCPSR